MSYLLVIRISFIETDSVDLFPQLCVGNDANDATIGQVGGIPPIVSFLASGLDNPLMVKAVTAAMHLLRDDYHNKTAFCNCGGKRATRWNILTQQPLNATCLQSKFTPEIKMVVTASTMSLPFRWGNQTSAHSSLPRQRARYECR